MADEKLLCPPEKKSDLEIRNQAIVAEYLADFVRHDRTRITEGVVLEIHGLTIADIYPCAGNYRDALTRIEVSKVAPIFTGEPLPAKLKKRKSEYVSGLKAADKGDLGPLKHLVLECFQQQITEISLHA